MPQPTREQLLAMLQHSGTPLAAAGAQPVFGRSTDDAFPLDKPTRDRLVITDPRCAPLLRRAVGAGDVQPWYAEPSGYVLDIPAGWSAAALGQELDEATAWQRLAERHRVLARYLEPFGAAARQRSAQGDFWWEQPVPQPPFGDDRLVSPLQSERPCFAPIPAGAVALGDTLEISGATPFLLGLLMSQAAWFALHSGTPQVERSLSPADLARLPVPPATEPEREAVGALAERAAAEAQRLAELVQRVRRRILGDLGPMGARLSPSLSAWWSLDFAMFRAEVTRQFGGDLPFRVREEWQAWLTQRQAEHVGQAAALDALQRQLDTFTEGLYGLDAAASAALHSYIDRNDIS